MLRNRCLGAMLVLVAVILMTSCDASKNVTEKKPPVLNSEVKHIVMTLQTMDSSRIADVKEVQDAVNAITIPEIGVEVEFKLIDAVDAFSQYSLWISNQETVDLMILNYQDITNYTSKKMLLPLDELLVEEGSDIRKIMGKEGYHLTEGSIIDGKAYGVANVANMIGAGGGIWIPERYFKEADLPFDAKYIYSLDELSVYFQKWKTLYPEKYPLGQLTSGITYSTMSYYSRSLECLGGDMLTGVIEEGEWQVSNAFASEAYYDFIKHMREWYQAGYIYPDAAIASSNIVEMVGSGMVMSYPLSSQPGLEASMESYFGEKVVCMRTTPVTSGAQYAKSGFWTIPVTSKNPQAAMRFLNKMFSDASVSNLIIWGIEGKHYVLTDEEHGVVAFPEGLNATTVGYYNPLGMYGDMRKVYTLSTYEQKQAEQEYSQEALENFVGIRGIIYSTERVSKQISAVQKVLERYYPVLESGSVDLEVYYPKFLRELEAAGINEIIADKQEQLDAWLSKQ